jgi:hypothetical protein
MQRLKVCSGFDPHPPSLVHRSSRDVVVAERATIGARPGEPTFPIRYSITSSALTSSVGGTVIRVQLDRLMRSARPVPRVRNR